MKLALFKTPTKIRELPGTQAKLLDVAQPGDIAYVLSDAVMSNGLTWHKLQHYRGPVGYSATNVGTDVLYAIFEPGAGFEQAINFTLKWEGVYVNNPMDPGGETKYGISKKSYYWVDIVNLTKEHATLIYYKDFWEPQGWEQYDAPKCTILFDIGVMAGPGQAHKLEELEPVAIIAAQLKFLANLSNFTNFGRGWVRRTTDLLELCLQKPV